MGGYRYSEFARGKRFDPGLNQLYAERHKKGDRELRIKIRKNLNIKKKNV